MKIISKDGDGNTVESYEMVPHRATFESGVLDIFRTIDSVEHKVVHQPWKFVNGVKADWSDIDEGIAWYKAGTEQVEE